MAIMGSIQGLNMQFGSLLIGALSVSLLIGLCLCLLPAACGLASLGTAHGLQYLSLYLCDCDTDTAYSVQLVSVVCAHRSPLALRACAGCSRRSAILSERDLPCTVASPIQESLGGYCVFWLVA